MQVSLMGHKEDKGKGQYSTIKQKQQPNQQKQQHQ